MTVNSLRTINHDGFRILTKKREYDGEGEGIWP